MAKLMRGVEERLATQEIRDGYIYLCVDKSTAYYDYKDAAGNLTRHKLSADFAERLRYVEDGATIEITPDMLALKTDIDTHNTSKSAHSDIRKLISELSTRLNTLADSDDTTLDQLSEIVNYIKSNKTLIDGITTNKVNVEDIVDDLNTDAANKPLSAAQGMALKALIDEKEYDFTFDTEPTENSENLVTSGAIYSYIDQHTASITPTVVTGVVG